MGAKIDKKVIKPIACSSTGGDPVVVESSEGKIVRIRPCNWTESYTEEELKDTLWEINARGKKLKCPRKAMPPYYALAYKKKTYSKDRVKYPLKRIDWSPGGDPTKINAQNRGVSGYERISWDEAIDILESEIRRMYDTYGPYSILGIGYDGHKESKCVHYGSGCQMQILRLIGGYVREVRTPDSVEGFYWGGKHVWGTGAWDGLGIPEDYYNTMKDVSENAEFLVMQAGDLETTANYASQFQSYMMKFWLDLGIEMVAVDPFGTYTAMIHDEITWIPILPNTDAALDFAIINVWLKEDLYDKEYVDTHVIGFDKMVDYVMGKEDGIEKTPAWASEITGIPEWTIKALARKWGSSRTTIGHFCGAHIRGPYSFEPGRTEYYKLGMQGIGKPGVQMIHLFSWNVAEQVVPSVGGMLSFMYMGHADMQDIPEANSIPRTAIHHAIMDGKYEWYGSPSIIMSTPEDQFIKRKYPCDDADGMEFHMIWSEKASNQASWNGGFYLQDAYRNPKIEFFVSNHQWMQCDTIFADLILPVTTCLEDVDSMGSSQGGSLCFYGIQDRACDVVGESKSDYEIAAELAKRFGVWEEYTRGLSVEEEIEAAYEESFIKEFIEFDDFKKRQYYIPIMNPMWEEIPAGMQEFYEDPEKHPLHTPSGKIEFYSEALAEHFPDDKERQPLAKWTIGGPAEEGWAHDESQWGEKAKTYPLLLNTSPGRWRIHVQNDDICWLREIPTCKIKGKDGYMYEPVWMCPELAAERGIKDGDIVKVFNDQGIVLGAARISERVLPNSIKMDKGAHPDPIAPHIDRGGCTNLISPPAPITKHCEGFVVTGYLVDVAKLEDSEMEQWKKDYPENFAREYDAASGSSRAGWVVKE